MLANTPPRIYSQTVLIRAVGPSPERGGPERGGYELMRVWLALLACGMALFLITAPPRAADSDGAHNELYRGIYLKIIPADPDVKSDIPLVDSDHALKTIKSAIDLIYERSPFNAKTLDLLKKRGDIVIIYDPGFPEWSRGDVTLAAFLPDFFEAAEGAPGETVFVAILGRYIIKHSPAEIAAEGIVHELVGHGVQHMHGRLQNLNGLNVECEASLYELQAFQDLGVDKFTGHMVRFRRELEEHHCDDFKRFMRKRKPWLMPLWDELDVDVVQLLSIFDEYLAQLPK
jgi:hypothetical protein